MFTERHSQYNTYKSLKSSVFTIEGIIGVGKTSLGKSLEKYLNNINIKAKFYPEYVNKELLCQYINDMKKYAYSFQLVMLFKRIEIYREAERFAASGGVALIDRSIIGDMTFAHLQKNNGNFTDEEWETYLSVMKQEIQLTPTASIYLKCTLDIAMQRINKRGIEAEIKGYTIEYLEQLNDAYECAIANCINVRHIPINWNSDVITDNNYLNDDSVISILNLLL